MYSNWNKGISLFLLVKLTFEMLIVCGPQHSFWPTAGCSGEHAAYLPLELTGIKIRYPMFRNTVSGGIDTFGCKAKRFYVNFALITACMFDSRTDAHCQLFSTTKFMVCPSLCLTSYFYSDVTWASEIDCLFQGVFHTNEKENTKAPKHWPKLPN